MWKLCNLFIKYAFDQNHSQTTRECEGNAMLNREN